MVYVYVVLLFYIILHCKTRLSANYSYMFHEAGFVLALFFVCCWSEQRISLRYSESFSLSLDVERVSQDLEEQKLLINDWCSHDMQLGYLATGCIIRSMDYLSSFLQDTVEPCHTTTVEECMKSASAQARVEFSESIALIEPTASNPISPPTASIRAHRREFIRYTHMMSEATLCTFHAMMKCSLQATLVLDLNCEDYGAQMGMLGDNYKYICVSGSHGMPVDNSTYFSSGLRELIIGDVFDPDLFRYIRRMSRLWTDSDTVVIVARQFIEFLSYSQSLEFLDRVKHSGASYFVSSNSAGALFHNPVKLDQSSEYTRLNMQKYPFHFKETRIKWRDSHISPMDMTEVYSISTDIPSGYPYYYDDLICGPDATVDSKRSFGPHCKYLNTLSSANWALFVHRAEGRVFSQDGQDGSLQYIFKHIGVSSKSFVEFGFNGPTYAHDSGANSNFLYQLGWRGLLLDGGNDNPDINLHKTWVDPYTIVSVFSKHNVPKDLDYLSIDIDSTELWTFRSILSSGQYRPRVVSVEYNSNYPLESTLCNVGNGYRWGGDRLFGSALLPLKMVGEEFGYSLANVVSYLDAIFIRNDLLNGSRVPDFETWRPFTSRPHHLAAQRTTEDIERYIVDYAEWSRNGNNFEMAKGNIVFDQIRLLNIEL